MAFCFACQVVAPDGEMRKAHIDVNPRRLNEGLEHELGARELELRAAEAAAAAG